MLSPPTKSEKKLAISMFTALKTVGCKIKITFFSTDAGNIHYDRRHDKRHGSHDCCNTCLYWSMSL